MRIPRSWAKASGQAETSEGKPRMLSVWGWGDNESTAWSEASRRLERALERLRGGAGEADAYAYDDRPPREELVQVLAKSGAEPTAALTRCRYGALVLNASRLLFLDIDLAPEGGLGKLKRLFGGADPLDAALERLRAPLRESGATFRLYRTAAGLRALAVDREFDPTAPGTKELMQRTGTDPAFVTLCRVQQTFRARLTPKPWRCACPNPPGEHPRSAPELARRFAAWRERYEQASERFATCRYLESVGSAAPAPALRDLVELHDRSTRSAEALPLA